MNNNLIGDMTILDLISLYEIYRSREKEYESDAFTNLLIRTLANEVQELHKENDEIKRLLEEILRRLK